MQSTFLEAVERLALDLEGQDSLNLANQVRAAAVAVDANDVAHLSTAIRNLTAEGIVEGTHIHPDAVVLGTVKSLLYSAEKASHIDTAPQLS